MLSFEACMKQLKDDYSARFEPATLKTYQLAVEQMLTYCQKPYWQITKKDIRGWLFHLGTMQYKAGTIQNKLKALRLFFRYCQEEGLIIDNPVESIPLPNVEDRLPYYLKKKQFEQLRELPSGNLKQRAVIELLYATGVRLQELANIKLEDVNWTERIIMIPKGKGKRERVVLFTRDCEEHLNAYLQTRKDDLPYLFLNQLGTQRGIPTGTIQGWFRTWKKQLGFHVTPHTLRHTFAAHLAQKGMKLPAIQVLLGHENPNNTKIYSRLCEEAQKQKYDEWM